MYIYYDPMMDTLILTTFHNGIQTNYLIHGEDEEGTFFTFEINDGFPLFQYIGVL